MPRTAIIEIKYKSKSMLPCPEKMVGMSEEEAEMRSAQILLEIGRNLRQAHKQKLSTKYPPASRPGEYPRRRSGSLQRGIYCDPESGQRIANSRRKTITIGYGIKDRKAYKTPHLYGPHLVNNMARKGIINTFYANRTAILAPARRWKPVVMTVLRGG
jgi:hypothetical protein